MFLLATGERGMGWKTVTKLSVQEFEELWAIQQRVMQKANTPENEEQSRELSVRRAIAMEHQGSLDTPPAAASIVIDPETATPAEIDAYLRAWNVPPI